MMQLAQDPRADRRRGNPGGSDRLRRCIVTRASLPAEQLVRFVVGPDGAVVPDVAGRLPGRGLWLCAARDIVERACAGNLFARAARTPVVVPDDLVHRVEALLAGRCLELIGLARRAGEAVAGFEKVRAMLSRSRAGVLLAACDASDDGRARLAGAAPEVPRIEVLTRAELGGVFGRDDAVHAAIAKGRLADRLIGEAARLAGFRPRQEFGKLN